jgi:hypothetical protein
MRCIPTLPGTLLLICLSLAACDKNQSGVTGVVELYLMDEFGTVGEGCAIDPGTVKLQQEPLLWYANFLSYSPSEYAFTITYDARDTIEKMEHSVFGVPFGVTAGGELIYTGYFWPGYSSLGCQWIVIDPVFWRDGDKLYVELGYPGLMEGAEVPDHRNDPRILGIFRRDGKLAE